MDERAAINEQSLPNASLHTKNSGRRK